MRDESYFWNRVIGLDAHHQTAVLVLKHQAMFPSFNAPPPNVASQTRRQEVGVVTAVKRVFSFAREVDMKITQAE